MRRTDRAAGNVALPKPPPKMKGGLSMKLLESLPATVVSGIVLAVVLALVLNGLG